MKNSELKQMSDVDLNKQLLDLLREQFNLRMQKGLGIAAKTHLFKRVRRDIARVKTFLRERGQQQ